MKLSTGLRDSLMGTLSMKELLDGSVIRVYQGTVPATADAALPGDAVLLVEIKTDLGAELTMDATIVDGTISKNAAETWEAAVGTSGTAAYFRMVKPADTGTLSTTAVRVQGVAGVGAEDMQLATAALVSAQTQRISFFNITLPEGT